VRRERLSEFLPETLARVPLVGVPLGGGCNFQVRETVTEKQGEEAAERHIAGSLQGFRRGAIKPGHL